MKSLSSEPSATVDWAAFEKAMLERRTLIYDFLDGWSGAVEFKPQDIHDGLFSYIHARGKALRPLLLLLCCGAVGGDEWQALPAAAAIEAFHTWTLVHDDVIDRDDTRRGSPTVHAQYTANAGEQYEVGLGEAAHYGMTVAILTGDLQQSWTYALLADLANRGVQPTLVLKLINRMSTSLTPQLMEGEMLDVQFSLTPPDALSEEQVLYMLGKKTGALLEYAAWCGVQIGLAGRPDKDDFSSRLSGFARLCGIAFQLHDDLLGLTADQAVLGKPIGSDIREGKRTLVVCKALELAREADRLAMLSTLGNPHATGQQIERLIGVVKSTGAEQWVRDLANSLISQALDLLRGLPDSEYKSLLAAWGTFMLARQH